MKLKYNQKYAQLIVNRVAENPYGYSDYEQLKKILTKEINEKVFWSTFKTLIIRKQLALENKAGTKICLTEYSQQVFDGKLTKFFKLITNNQTFAAALGAAIGVNIDKIFYWLSKLL